MIVVGTLESSDCLITLKDSHAQIIEIESIVYDSFKDQIETVIKKTLDSESLTNVHVNIQDKGALDFTIEARLRTAIKRLKERG